MNIKLFPWDHEDNKPFWVNPSNGFEWWIDRSLTDYCEKEDASSNKRPLKAVCFFVVEVDKDKRNPLTRVLVDLKSNRVLKSTKNFEEMAAYIDKLGIYLQFKNEEE